MFDKQPEEWHTVKVEYIAAPDKYACVGGPFGSNLTRKDYVTTLGTPVSRGSNLTLGERFFKDDDFVFMSEDKAVSLIQNTAYPGDIVFTQRGTIGQVALIPKNSIFPKYILSQNQMKLTPDPTKADVGFLLYYFLSPIAQEIILRNSIGSTIPGFNLTQLRQFPVPLPPFPEQKAIAQILSSLDDKIELNREMNQTLEAIARAIFKSWFVDFDPVRAKMEGRQPAGMDAATAELFPDEFDMKIPPDAIIADEKITRYLLVPREQDNKSKFLAQAGFTQENPELLKAAIRQLADSTAAIQDRDNEYGVFYRVTGELIGLNQRNLAVITVWLQKAFDGKFQFITLKPNKESSNEL